MNEELSKFMEDTKDFIKGMGLKKNLKKNLEKIKPLGSINIIEPTKNISGFIMGKTTIPTANSFKVSFNTLSLYDIYHRKCEKKYDKIIIDELSNEIFNSFAKLDIKENKNTLLILNDYKIDMIGSVVLFDVDYGLMFEGCDSERRIVKYNDGISYIDKNRIVTTQFISNPMGETIATDIETVEVGSGKDKSTLTDEILFYKDIITPNLEIFVKTNNGTFEKYFVRKKQITDILDHKYKVVGYCKECNEPIVEGYKIPEYDMYECPRCAYPNSKDDMWYKSVTIEEGMCKPRTTVSKEIEYNSRPVDFIDFYKKNIQDNDTVINELKNKTLIFTDDNFQTARVGLNFVDLQNKQPETQEYSDNAKYIINRSQIFIGKNGIEFRHGDKVYTINNDINELKNIK